MDASVAVSSAAQVNADAEKAEALKEVSFDESAETQEKWFEMGRWGIGCSLEQLKKEKEKEKHAKERKSKQQYSQKAEDVSETRNEKESVKSIDKEMLPLQKKTLEMPETSHLTDTASVTACQSFWVLCVLCERENGRSLWFYSALCATVEWCYLLLYQISYPQRMTSLPPFRLAECLQSGSSLRFRLLRRVFPCGACGGGAFCGWPGQAVRFAKGQLEAPPFRQYPPKRATMNHPVAQHAKRKGKRKRWKKWSQRKAMLTLLDLLLLSSRLYAEALEMIKHLCPFRLLECLAKATAKVQLMLLLSWWVQG